jgi:hypothetical protein
MNSQYISTRGIEKIIKYLKSKNTGGDDEISTRILNLSAPYIMSPLTYICKANINFGIFPDSLKYAINKTIFKKCNDQEIMNFISISF